MSGRARTSGGRFDLRIPARGSIARSLEGRRRSVHGAILAGTLFASLSPAAWHGPALAQGGLPPAARVVVPDSIRGTPAEARLLLRALQRADADSVARRLMADSEERHGAGSIEAADALDLLVEVLAPLERPRVLDRARPLAERAQAIRDSLLAPDDPRRAPGLDLLAEVAWASGDTTRAWALAERSLALRRAAYGPDHAEVAGSLLLMGRLKQRAGDGPAARALMEQALAIQERSPRPDPLAISVTLEELVNLSAVVGAPQGDHISYLRRLVGLCEQILGAHQAYTILATMELGGELVAVAPQEAERLLERALDAGEASLGPAHPLVARVHAKLLSYHQTQFDPVAARDFVDRATARFPDDYQVLWVGSWIYEQLGDYDRAVEVSRRALERVDRASVRPDQVLGALQNLAHHEMLAGAYLEADRHLARAMRACDSLPEPGDLTDYGRWEVGMNCARTFTSAAELRVLTGDNAAADSLFRRAIAAWRRIAPAGSGWSAEAGFALRAHGRFLRRTGDPGAASGQFEEALKVWASLEVPGDHPAVLGCMQGMADAELARGHRARARDLYERSVAMQERTVPPDHPSRVETLRGLAALDWAEGRLDSARDRLRRARALALEAYGPAHPQVAASLQSLALVELARGDERAALSAAVEAEAAGREHVRLTARGLPERRALAYSGTRNAGLDAAVLAARALADTASVRAAWDAVIRSRGMVLDEMAARHRAIARAEADVGTDSLWRALRCAQARLANLLVRSLDATMAPGDTTPDWREREIRRLRDVHRAARDEKERIERSLAERSATFRRERASAATGYAAVAGAVPAGGAVVAYCQYRSLDPSAGPDRAGNGPGRYAAFVLSHGGVPSLVDLGDAGEVDLLVGRWREESSRPGVDGAAYRRAGRRLAARVWDPVASRLGSVERLFVVPDGALNLVGFAALPDRDGGYLVEGGPLLQSLSAERDLATPREGGAVSEGLLAVGDPQFDGDAKSAVVAPGAYRGTRSGCGEFRSERFDPLPATATEVGEVGALWRGADAARRAEVLLGPEASEAAFKARAPGHRVLHLATHGFFLGGECRSALERTRGVGGITLSEPPLAEIGENPLLLSGLALAGANRRDEAGPEEEDGILTADEIASLDLSGVEWAVLSACETGVGEVRAGEGVFGLRRAFQVAGARTLIMSLWSVEDEATRAWMGHLYRARLEDGLDTAASVRAASLAVLKERREKGQSTHPFYWGAFVAAGDWR